MKSRTIFLFFILLFSSSFLQADENVLTLSENIVTERVLEKNLQVKQIQLNPSIAEEQITLSKAKFDVTLDVNAAHSRDELERSSAFFGNRIDSTLFNLDLKKEFATGTTTSLGYSHTRSKTFGSTIISSTPLYEGVLELQLSQSLWNNAWGANSRRVLESSKLSSASVDFASKRSVQEVLLGVLDAYWNWNVSQQQCKAKKESLDQAKHFLSIVRKKEHLGAVEETDVLAIQANVLLRTSALLESENIRDAFEAELRTALDIDDDVTLLFSAEKSEKKKISYTQDLLESALAERPDFQAQKKNVERLGVDFAVAKNRRYPNLELVGTLAENDIDASVSESFQTDHPKWSLGVNFSFPLQNRKARALYTQSKLQKMQAVFELRRLKLSIDHELQQLSDAFHRKAQQVEKLEEAKHLHARKLWQETEKYQMGRSSSERIINFQDDLIEAEDRVLNMWKEYKNTEMKFELAKGTLGSAAFQKSVQE